MKTKKDFLAKYDKIVKDITKRVNHVNRGGCGVYASLLGEELKKTKVKFEYVILFRGSIDKYDNEEIENGIANNDVDTINQYAWTHVMIKLNNRKFIDGEGVYPSAQMSGKKLKHKEISEELLNGMLDKTYIWNPMFKRQTEKRKIKKILEKHLEITK